MVCQELRGFYEGLYRGILEIRGRQNQEDFLLVF